MPPSLLAERVCTLRSGSGSQGSNCAASTVSTAAGRYEPGRRDVATLCLLCSDSLQTHWRGCLRRATPLCCAPRQQRASLSRFSNASCRASRAAARPRCCRGSQDTQSLVAQGAELLRERGLSAAPLTRVQAAPSNEAMNWALGGRAHALSDEHKLVRALALCAVRRWADCRGIWDRPSAELMSACSSGVPTGFPAAYYSVQRGTPDPRE